MVFFDNTKITLFRNSLMNIDPKKLEPLKGILRKPHVNSTCIGCSACVSVTSGEYFDLDDDGLSTVRHCEKYDQEMVDDAIASCPVNAISWQSCDETGKYSDGIREHEDVA